MLTGLANLAIMAIIAGHSRPVSGAAAAVARPWERPTAVYEREQPSDSHLERERHFTLSDSHFIHHEEPGARLTLRTHRQGVPVGGPHEPFFTGFFPGGPHQRPFSDPVRPSHGPHRPKDTNVGPQLRPAHPPPPKPHGALTQEKQIFVNEGPGGCQTNEGFYFAGQKWFVKGCRRRTCIHFRGSFIIETDSCDSEIFNTTYKCIVQVDTTAQYPNCCPTYRCNPDNLGNSVK